MNSLCHSVSYSYVSHPEWFKVNLYTKDATILPGVRVQNYLLHLSFLHFGDDRTFLQVCLQLIKAILAGFITRWLLLGIQYVTKFQLKGLYCIQYFKPVLLLLNRDTFNSHFYN